MKESSHAGRRLIKTAVSRIKCIHIYDFDNTCECRRAPLNGLWLSPRPVFASPQPSQQLWTGLTVGQLCNPDIFIAGGWWHDVDILAATGGGAAIEEARAWRGWWNESIVRSRLGCTRAGKC